MCNTGTSAAAIVLVLFILLIIILGLFILLIIILGAYI